MSLIKKFKDDIEKPSKCSTLLRGFSQTNYFLLKHSLQTWLVSRIKPCELPKLPKHKFDLQSTTTNIFIYHVNKLTMLLSGLS